jgi:hypothetical protein
MHTRTAEAPLSLGLVLKLIPLQPLVLGLAKVQQCWC